MGVWIETNRLGLGFGRSRVTPYVGVWIETWKCGIKPSISQVTPYVGVWIETRYVSSVTLADVSLLMWECGLKHLTH